MELLVIFPNCPGLGSLNVGGHQYTCELPIIMRADATVQLVGAFWTAEREVGAANIANNQIKIGPIPLTRSYT